MKRLSILALALALAAPAAAQHLGPGAPAKTPVPAQQTRVRDRQGGDTMADALLVPSLPYEDVGTTVGYTNDYDEVCPYTGSTAPDVVYKLQVPAAAVIEIDMCGSGFDTKIYVYREDFTVVACNDDFYFDDTCGVYVSRLEEIELDPSVKYFVVIDGYGNAAGDYDLVIDHFLPEPPCVVDCIGVSEGEPQLVNEYVDNWNGGCNTSPGYPFQELYGGWYDLTFCGRSGWYLYVGSNYRDTDWYRLYMGYSGVVEVTGDAESESYMFELGPQDCASVAVLQTVIIGPCQENTMTITGYGSWQPIWFWVGPTVFAPPEGNPPQEYDYVLWFSGLGYNSAPIATEATTWGTVKSLFH